VRRARARVHRPELGVALTDTLPDRWDEEADLVVVGSGAAGLTGAVVAALEGARVVVLEKSEFIGGTSAISGGGFWIPVNHHAAEVGVDDTREEALAYLRACAGGNGDDAILVALVEHGADMVRLLEERAGASFRPWPSQGGTIDYRPWLPGAKHGGRTLDPGKFGLSTLGEWAPKLRLGFQSAWLMDRLDFYAKRMHTLPPDPHAPVRARPSFLIPGEEIGEDLSSGSALVGQLLRACVQQGVTLLTAAPGEQLLLSDGAVVGVRAGRDGEPWFVRARHGVLMATGGYGGSEELKRLWLRRPLEFTCEVDENEGDGHLMGLAVGAQVANLGDAWWMPRTPRDESADGVVNIGGTREDRILPHTLIVNRRGERFVNEAMNYHDVCEAFGENVGGSPRNLPAWLVFDTQGRRKYAGLAGKIPHGAQPSYLTVADSLDELAEALGIDVLALRSTVARFNEFARTGVDLDFHRGESEWDRLWGDPDNHPNPSLGTLEVGPFYAVPLYSGALATKGGLRVNEHAEVLSAALPFAPIAGLYAAGNCSNAAVAGAYQGAGATLGAAMTFGYIAGRRVASAARSGAGTPVVPPG
jgi:3-oxosteroid 1-dehydrogenase